MKKNSQSMTQSIWRSLGKMSSATFLSRILGLVREQAMALYFGASGITDAFLVAYRIPNMLRDLFAEGSFSAAFVPLFTEKKTTSDNTAAHFFWSALILLSSITLALSVFIFLFAPDLVVWLAPEFRSSPEKLEMTVTMTKILSPFIFFISISALIMGVLNTYRIFFIPSMTSAVFNLVFIGVLWFGYGLGWFPNTELLAVCAISGCFIQTLFQIPSLVKNTPLAWVNPWPIFNPDTKRLFAQMLPSLFGFAATQINLIVVTVLATSQEEGAVSWLNYAFRLFQFPIGIISVSLASSHLVHYSALLKEKKIQASSELFQQMVKLLLFLILPITLIVLLTSDLIVELVFERGAFTSEDTFQTSQALMFYALGLPFSSLYKIFVPTFYALEKPYVPVTSAAISIIFNIIFCWSLVDDYGFSILALGMSLSMLLNTALQMGLIAKLIQLSLHKGHWKVLGQFVVGCFCSAGVLIFLQVNFLVEGLVYWALGLFWLLLASLGIFSFYLGWRLSGGEKLHKILKMA